MASQNVCVRESPRQSHVICLGGTIQCTTSRFSDVVEHALMYEAVVISGILSVNLSLKRVNDSFLAAGHAACL